MDPDLAGLVSRVFTARENEGSNKVMALGDAVRNYVRPGMALHIGSDAGAGICELLRQFWGSSPGFTVIIGLMEGHALNLIHAGLVRKVIASICGNLNPTPGPSPIAQRAIETGETEIENWSVYSIFQRLMAAALGMAFLPTRAIAGTTMAHDNSNAFAWVSDPFSGDNVPVVKSLTPDISLIHGIVADHAGNTIPVFADSESYWGARASKEGAIVTVEHVVSTDFIRDHSTFVKLPSHMVRAVCPAPFGAHPQSLFVRWLDGIKAYGEDREFVLEHRRAANSKETLDQWINEWVLSCTNHDDYLGKLGDLRLNSLRNRGEPEGWVEELSSLLGDGFTSPEYNSTEMMIVAAARRIQHRMNFNGYKVILSGVGTCSLASALAYYGLRQRGYDADVMIGTGQFGFLPKVGNLDSVQHMMSAKAGSDILDIYGSFMHGEDSLSFGVMGAAMIDKYGNVNSTRLPGGRFLIGSGGGNDITAGAAEVMVIAQQSQQRFVERVEYITAPGECIETLVSDKGIFEKQDGEFTLTACYMDSSLEEAIAKTKATCGWDLKIANDMLYEPPPTLEELEIIRILDARGEFLNG